jgi:hypothetical protein
MLIALVLQAALQLATPANQAQAEGLSFESPGITVKALVQEIAQRTGLNLDSQGLENRLVIVRYDHVKPQDALKALSDAEVCTWIKSGEKQILRADPVQAEKLFQSWAAAREKANEKDLAQLESLAGPLRYDQAFLKGQAEALAATNKHPNDVGEFTKAETLSYSLPGGRMLIRALRSITPARLSQLLPGEYYTFAANPNSLQLALDGAENIVAQFREEQSAWMDASGPVLPGRWRRFTIDSPAPAQSDVGLLIDFYGGYRSHLGVAHLRVFDDSGKVVNEFVNPMTVNRPEENAAQEAKEHRINDSKVFAEVPEITEQILRRKGPWKVGSQFREVVLHPDKHNLPAMGPGTAILASARAMGVNLTVPLHDGAIFTYPDYWQGHKLRAQLVLGSIVDPKIASASQQPNWLVTRPESFELWKLSNAPIAMADLAEFAQYVERERVLSLEAYSSLRALANGFSSGTSNLRQPGHSWILAFQARALLAAIPGLQGAGWVEDNYDPIELYGEIPETARTLARQSPIPISNLPSETQNALFRTLLKRPLTRTNLPKGGTGTIWTEPTIFFPSAAAQGGTLTIKEENYETYQWKSPETGGWREAYPPKPIPAANADPNMSSEISAPPDRFRAVHGRKIFLIFQWPTAILKIALTCDDPKGQVVNTFDDLPEPIRSQNKNGD